MITRCNNAGIEWYRRMPADPPLVDAKGEKLIETHGEDATLKASDLRTDNWPPH